MRLFDKWLCTLLAFAYVANEAHASKFTIEDDSRNLQYKLIQDRTVSEISQGSVSSLTEAGKCKTSLRLTPCQAKQLIPFLAQLCIITVLVILLLIWCRPPEKEVVVEKKSIPAPPAPVAFVPIVRHESSSSSSSSDSESEKKKTTKIKKTIGAASVKRPAVIERVAVEARAPVVEAIRGPSVEYRSVEVPQQYRDVEYRSVSAPRAEVVETAFVATSNERLRPPPAYTGGATQMEYRDVEYRSVGEVAETGFVAGSSGSFSPPTAYKTGGEVVETGFVPRSTGAIGGASQMQYRDGVAAVTESVAVEARVPAAGSIQRPNAEYRSVEVQQAKEVLQTGVVAGSSARPSPPMTYTGGD